MRAMNLGDKAFFYHSNCKEPGIAGIMKIVKEFSEDSKTIAPSFPPFFYPLPSPQLYMYTSTQTEQDLITTPQGPPAAPEQPTMTPPRRRRSPSGASSTWNSSRSSRCPSR